MAARINPIITVIPNYSDLDPEHLAANQRFMERLLESPEGTTIVRITDDPNNVTNGYYDLYWFPGQYQGGAIPAPVLAKILRIYTPNAGQGIEDMLARWFIVNHKAKEGGYNDLPTPPDPDREIYRDGDRRTLRIEVIESYEGHERVGVVVGNPCDGTSHGRASILLTAAEAQALANTLDGTGQLVDKSGELNWKPTTTHTRLVVREDRSVWGIDVPHYVVPAVINALLTTARKIS